MKAGTRLVGVAFPEETSAPEKNSLRQYELVGVGLAIDDIDQPGVGSVSIDGPYNPSGPGDTPSRRKILVCSPANSRDEEPCAKKILSTLVFGGPETLIQKRGYPTPRLFVRVLGRPRWPPVLLKSFLNLPTPFIMDKSQE